MPRQTEGWMDRRILPATPGGFLPKWVAKKIATGRLKKIILSYFNPSLTLKKLFFSLIVYTTKG